MFQLVLHIVVVALFSIVLAQVIKNDSNKFFMADVKDKGKYLSYIIFNTVILMAVFATFLYTMFKGN
jgi:Na+/melibiose symporter-like transporter